VTPKGGLIRFEKGYGRGLKMPNFSKGNGDPVCFGYLADVSAGPCNVNLLIQMSLIFIPEQTEDSTAM
jgi:hypothetical protein